MNKITVPFNPIFKPVHQCKKRYVVMKGSAGSGKSVDTAQLYILRLMRDKGRNLVCVRKSDITNRDSTFAELEISHKPYGRWQSVESYAKPVVVHLYKRQQDYISWCQR